MRSLTVIDVPEQRESKDHDLMEYLMGMRDDLPARRASRGDYLPFEREMLSERARTLSREQLQSGANNLLPNHIYEATRLDARYGVTMASEEDKKYGHFSSEQIGECFFCGRKTFRVDIDYGGYYCGLDDEAIEKDLRPRG